MSTGIEWTSETWNPTTGCDQVSPGCDNCYALRMAARLKAMGQDKYQADGDPRTSGPGFAIQEHPDRLDQPLHWRKPRRVFVDSMSDLFHPGVSDEFIARAFGTMAATGRHHYQVLTKRPKRAKALLNDHEFRHRADSVTPWFTNGSDLPEDLDDPPWPLPNVWLGVSVEDQQRADQRIPPLMNTSAAVRFLSCEPLLGSIDLTKRGVPPRSFDRYLDRFDWVIVGGESGPGARPMHPEWVREIRDQCVATGVPLFFKQWGSWHPVDTEEPGWGIEAVHRCGDHDESCPSWEEDPRRYAFMERISKKAAGRELDGRTWDQFPAELEVRA